MDSTPMQYHNLTIAPVLAGVLAVATVLLPAYSSGAEAGQPGPEAFNNNCRTCHSVKEGDNRLGPSLHQIVGRKAGSAAGYGSYSQALKNSGITWDEATLEKFITNPETVVPNNNMKPFKGITDPAVREKIVAYLKSAS
jgi:cytochrome c